MGTHQIKTVAMALTVGALTVVGFQNCSNVKFDQSEQASLAAPNVIVDPGTVPQVADPVVPQDDTTQVQVPVSQQSKITCSVGSVPAVKPAGFVYSSARGACMPASGYGPSYQFTITCDADIPQEVLGIRIQYMPNYFSHITNPKFYLNNALTYYSGRSFYKPSVAPGGTPAASLATTYGLTNIQKINNRIVRAQANFFFLDGYPEDISNPNCNNMRSMDLSLYIYVGDAAGSPALFTNQPAKLLLQ
jgi:hypothetical protein